jgi:ribosomal protein S27AE
MKQKRFCPNCGSDWVEPDTSNRAEVYFSGGNPNKWKCRECGYTGIMPEGDSEDSIEETAEDENSIRFEPEDNYNREDVNFGTAYAKYVLYIALPLMLLATLYILL